MPSDRHGADYVQEVVIPSLMDRVGMKMPPPAIQEKVIKNQQELWEEDQLIDYTIKVQGIDIKVHKLILASGSDYFRALLTNDFKDSRKNCIELEGQDPTEVKALIKYLYTGKIEITLGNLSGILDTALYLQIKEAVDDCCSFIYANLRPETYNDILNTLKKFQLNDVEKKVLDSMCQNADSVIASSFLDNLSVEEACILFANWKGPCFDLLGHVRRWIDFDEKRLDFIYKVLPTVQFPLMTLDQLESIRDEVIFGAEKDKLWKNLVEQALEYYKLPVWRKVLKQGACYTPNTEKKLTVFLTENADRTTHMLGPRYYSLDYGRVEVEDEEDWDWKVHDLPPGDDISVTWNSSSTVYNNYLIVAGGRSKDAVICKECWIFDPRCKRWSAIAKMNQQRAHFPLVAADGKLYAIAGCPDCLGFDVEGVMAECEVYDLESNTWSQTTPLPIRLGFHVSLYLSGKIYVTGGLTCEDNAHPIARTENRQLFAYDVKMNAWETLAPMKYHRAGTLIPMTHKGEQYILAFGTRDSVDVRFDSVEVTQEELEYFSPVANQWTQFSGFGDSGDISMKDIVHPTKNEIFSLGRDFDKYSFEMDDNGVDVSMTEQLPYILDGTDADDYNIHIAAYLAFID